MSVPDTDVNTRTVWISTLTAPSGVGDVECLGTRITGTLVVGGRTTL